MYVMKTYETYCATEEQTNSTSTLHTEILPHGLVSMYQKPSDICLCIKIEIFQKIYLII